MAYVFDCAVVLRLLLLTLLMLPLLTSKLSSACSQLIRQFFLPSTLYLRSSGGLSSLFIHTYLSPPSYPSAMVSSFSSSSSNTTRIYFGIIPSISPQRPGKALWVVRDSHPLFPPLGFVTASATTMLSIFTSCSVYDFSISVGSKCTILHSLFMYCFNTNMLHVRSCTFSPSKLFTLVSW